MGIQYAKIYNVPHIDDGVFVLNFKGVEFLNTFEIVELFAYCAKMPFSGGTYKIINETEATQYLKRVNFFYLLEQVKNFSPYCNKSIHTNKQNRLLELQLYNHKEQFYGDQEKIFKMLKSVGLSDETVALVATSLAEIVDNTFFHNLGKWSTDIETRSVLLMQKFQNKRELCFSYCDFGVGFLATLSSNYPSLTDEYKSLELALKENVTSRLPQRGGNGLNYLQKNIFNGFKGTLMIRSNDTLVKVDGKENVVLIDNNIKSMHGVNVLFSLKY